MTKKGHASNESSQSLNIDFKNLPPELQEKLLQQAPPHHKPPRTVHFGMEQQVTRSAPLPHPDELQGYEQILPGAFERILKLHEDTSRGKLELFGKELDNKRFICEKNFELAEFDLLHSTKSERRGQWMALLVALSIIFLIGFAIYSHAAWEITACLAAVFGGSIATIFLTNRTPSKKNSEEKNNMPSEKEER
ncbi:DUF2335 domain-containing protein [Acetobacteraceae bacterium]|nr:DUF2335 domain-containing protein [Acetobacteraceae bacterium]